MARQQLGPKYVSPLIKKRMTSPVHARSSNRDSQHLYELSNCNRVARVEALEDGVVRACTDSSSKVRKKSRLREFSIADMIEEADVRNR
ncbi:hypothetical protein ACHQM5_000229 [Ranunculus cassubicifolius]